MMKLLSDSVPKWAAAVFSILVLGALVGVAAYVGTWLAAPRHSPIVFRSTGPTIRELEEMGELATMRVNVIDVLTAEGDGYRGSWLIRGDALLTCDMSLAKVQERDDEQQTATILLPLPSPVSPRVDHEKTKTWSVEKSTWIPWRWGDEDAFRDAAMFHAQQLVEEATGSDHNISTAKMHTELIVRNTFKMVGWNVVIRWQPQDYEQSQNK